MAEFNGHFRPPLAAVTGYPKGRTRSWSRILESVASPANYNENLSMLHLRGCKLRRRREPKTLQLAKIIKMALKAESQDLRDACTLEKMW